MIVITRTKLKTYHDVIPISCLTEFPNVVQMAKVRAWLGAVYQNICSKVEKCHNSIIMTLDESVHDFMCLLFDSLSVKK